MSRLGYVTPPTAEPEPVYGWDDAHENYTLKLDANNVSVGNADSLFNYDGSVTFAANGSDYPDIWFILPEAVRGPMSSVTFTYKSVIGAGFGTAYQYTDSTGDEDIAWGGKLTNGKTTETINIQNTTKTFSKIKCFVPEENVSGRSVTITSVVFHAAPTPTAAPTTGPTAGPGETETPYVCDLTEYNGENGSVDVSYDADGACVVTMGQYRGIKFNDAPGDEYKYVVLTYKKTGGDVNAYPDENTEHKLSNASEYTRVVLSPQRTSGTQKFKLFNFGSEVTVYVKSVEFYKNDPS